MGDKLLENSSGSDTSEEEDEDAKELTEDIEKNFFKTLSYIKKKDPKIYDEKIKFFSKDEPEESQIQSKPKKTKKDSPLTLRAYERKLIVERGGELSDEEFIKEEEIPYSSADINAERSKLKEGFKIIDSDDSDNDKVGGMFFKGKQSVQEIKKDQEYRDWFIGQRDTLIDKKAQEDLEYLREHWKDPNLDEGEQFLRDYILNKRFLEKDNEPEFDMEKLIEEEKELEEQTEFENKYNYRFEDPDQEFIKRYPRVMANSLRVKDERRKEKREEIRERKMKEKEKKREEIKKRKKIKKKEIDDKLEELKKLTGNDQLAFENHLDADFDQDEYDRVMKRLFNEEFYSQTDPEFNPKDAVTEDFEGYDDYFENEEGNDYIHNEDDDNALNCEDPNFIMDCDYDPTNVSKKKKKDGKGRRARDKHRRTTVSEAVSREKPQFDPTQHCSFQDYLDQYYGIDCEDFIGDIQCRFKYKRVTPNSYGLTVEEILAADDKELEHWCSMKRVHKNLPEYKEKNDAKMYSKKSKNDEIKKKILPSLYPEILEEEQNETPNTMKKKKKKKKQVLTSLPSSKEEVEEEVRNAKKENKATENSTEGLNFNEEVVVSKKEKKRKRKDKSNTNDENNKLEQNHSEDSHRNDSISEFIDSNDKKNKKGKKRKRKQESEVLNNNDLQNHENHNNKKIKLKNEETLSTIDTSVNADIKKEHKQKNSNLCTDGPDLNKNKGKSRRQKRNEKAKLLKKERKESNKSIRLLKVADKYEKKRNTFKTKVNDNNVGITDSRLKAYGIKPKVFKDKLKYGTQFSKFKDT